jgi:hypothetical protein
VRRAHRRRQISFGAAAPGGGFGAYDTASKHLDDDADAVPRHGLAAAVLGSRLHLVSGDVQPRAAATRRSNTTTR